MASTSTRVGIRQLHSSRSLSNHYDTLKLPKSATRQQIKAQFYRLSKEYHPDVKPGSEAKFQAISEAYATLGNADSRRSYDSSIGSTSSSAHYHHRPGYTSYTPASSTYPHHENYSESGARRARANYAWEHTRRTNPRYTYQRHNPFSHQHSSAQRPEEDDIFERMSAREAWRASNLSSGAKKRMMYESEKILQEENLRNTSSMIRAVQFTSLFLGVLWISSTLRASAWEKEPGGDDDDKSQARFMAVCVVDTIMGKAK